VHDDGRDALVVEQVGLLVLAREEQRRDHGQQHQDREHAVEPADDLLTATLLTAHCPVVFVPAMHTEMWLHPATQDNVATLRRRGTSSRGVSAKLAAKGVPREVVESAMQAERDALPDGEAEAIEAQAAHAYAKRRRLGPHRRPDIRAAHRDRDLAALARAGFSYGLARRVVDAEPDEQA